MPRLFLRSPDRVKQRRLNSRIDFAPSDLNTLFPFSVDGTSQIYYSLLSRPKTHFENHSLKIWFAASDCSHKIQCCATTSRRVKLGRNLPIFADISGLSTLSLVACTNNVGMSIVSLLSLVTNLSVRRCGVGHVSEARTYARSSSQFT
jgi:hypothetical protein